MTDRMKKIVFMLGIFALGFAMAMLMGRSSPVPSGHGAAKASGVVDAAGLGKFLDAARRSDYAAMSDLGTPLFKTGLTVKNSKTLFKDYESNSFPPYTVFAFYSEGSNERVRRVLLTLDADERVEAFLAEEMKVMQ